MEWAPSAQGNITVFKHSHRGHSSGRRSVELASTSITHTSLTHTGLTRAALIVVITVLATNIPGAATADSHSVAQPERVSATVSLADLDLATPEGARLAHDRLAKTALTLCRRFSDTRRASDRATVADCVREALAEAIHSRSRSSDGSATR
jgi:UrcA family protein